MILISNPDKSQWQEILKRPVMNTENLFDTVRSVIDRVKEEGDRAVLDYEEKFDKVKNQTFYRCLGGGIEFLEKSSDALKREFKEEINTDIIVKDFLGISENIFTFNGKNAHELILFYSIDIVDSDYKDEYNIIDRGGEFSAKWIDIDDFKNKSKILYPEEVFKYL